jgi:lipopolysaccharide/colanic/teichoic acid biosynthesis glycosyltransferase
VIYRSTRVGHLGRRFQMWKFRTMTHGSDGPSLSARTDGRVTRLGRMLRTSRLDELPQLWNVIRGDMSLVGPRPELPEFVDRYADDYERILQVAPGITGVTQLQFAAVEAHLLSASNDPVVYYTDHLLPRKVVLDREYAERRTLLGDVRLLVSTFGFTGRLLAQRLGAITAARRAAFRSYALGVGVSGILLLVFVATSGAPR